MRLIWLLGEGDGYDCFCTDAIPVEAESVEALQLQILEAAQQARLQGEYRFSFLLGRTLEVAQFLGEHGDVFLPEVYPLETWWQNNVKGG